MIDPSIPETIALRLSHEERAWIEKVQSRRMRVASEGKGSLHNATVSQIVRDALARARKGKMR
jgi:hypothetical protein